MRIGMIPHDSTRYFDVDGIAGGRCWAMSATVLQDLPCIYLKRQVSYDRTSISCHTVIPVHYVGEEPVITDALYCRCGLDVFGQKQNELCVKTTLRCVTISSAA